MHKTGQQKVNAERLQVAEREEGRTELLYY